MRLDTPWDQIRGSAMWFMVSGAGILTTLFVVGIGVYVARNTDGSVEITLPLVLIMGVVALVMVLGLLTFGFSMLDLANRDEALGLPSGSVRAVIALMLLVIFAIIAIFIYSNVSNSGKIKEWTNVTKDQVEDLRRTVTVILVQPSSERRASESRAVATKTGEPKQSPAPGQTTTPSTQSTASSPTTGQTTSGTPTTTEQTTAQTPTPNQTFTVYYRDANTPAGDDIAKQLIVLLGTLVTAVSSFYFGANVVAAAKKDASSSTPPSPPKPTGVAPQPMKPLEGAQDLAISGENLAGVKAVKLVKDKDTITAEVKATGPSLVSAKVTVGGSNAGKWDVLVSDGTTEVKVPVQLEIG